MPLAPRRGGRKTDGTASDQRLTQLMREPCIASPVAANASPGAAPVAGIAGPNSPPFASLSADVRKPLQVGAHGFGSALKQSGDFGEGAQPVFGCPPVTRRPFAGRRAMT